ncbi:DUF6907 domain-containing protein [Streptomyces sp. NPDC058391]|uniref:DUF6907 domain-containing protein n=1 Tax=Streptomyces sp. NPDC058391 TaxID=3346476 RepID=UPI00364F4081
MSDLSEPLHGRAADGTITITTSDHGPVTVSEPAWCTGQYHQAGGARVDITHTSVDIPFNLDVGDGPITVMRAVFEQRPFTELTPGRAVFVNVELDGDWTPCTVRQLNQLAAGLAMHPMHLRTLATQLADLLAGGGQ